MREDDVGLLICKSVQISKRSLIRTKCRRRINSSTMGSGNERTVYCRMRDEVSKIQQDAGIRYLGLGWASQMRRILWGLQVMHDDNSCFRAIFCPKRGLLNGWESRCR